MHNSQGKMEITMLGLGELCKFGSGLQMQGFMGTYRDSGNYLTWEEVKAYLKKLGLKSKTVDFLSRESEWEDSSYNLLFEAK